MYYRKNRPISTKSEEISNGPPADLSIPTYVYMIHIGFGEYLGGTILVLHDTFNKWAKPDGA